MPSLRNRVVLPFSLFRFSWQSAYRIFIACFGFFPHVRRPLCLAGSFLVFLLELSPVMETLCASLSLKICLKYSIRRYLLFIVWITDLPLQCSEVARKSSIRSRNWIPLGFFLINFGPFEGFVEKAQISSSAWEIGNSGLGGVQFEQKCMNGISGAIAYVTSPRWTGLWMWCCWR